MSHEKKLPPGKFHGDSKYTYDPEWLKDFNVEAGHDRAVWGKGRGVPRCRGKTAVEAEMGYGLIDGQVAINGVVIGKEPVLEMPF